MSELSNSGCMMFLKNRGIVWRWWRQCVIGVLSSTAQCSTVQCSATQHSASQHSAAQSSAAQCSAAQRSTVQHSTVQHSVVQHSAAQHSATQHSAAQHSTLNDISVMHVAELSCWWSTCTVCVCVCDGLVTVAAGAACVDWRAAEDCERPVEWPAVVGQCGEQLPGFWAAGNWLETQRECCEANMQLQWWCWLMVSVVEWWLANEVNILTYIIQVCLAPGRDTFIYVCCWPV